MCLKKLSCRFCFRHIINRIYRIGIRCCSTGKEGRKLAGTDPLKARIFRLLRFLAPMRNLLPRHGKIAFVPCPNRLCAMTERSRVHGHKTVLASFHISFGVNCSMYWRHFNIVLTPTLMTGHIGETIWPQAESVWPHADLWLATLGIALW